MRSRYFNFIISVLLMMAGFTLTACSDDDEMAQRKYPAPVLTEVTPIEGLPNSIVVLKGSEFGKERTERIGRVYFGGVEATEYVSWSDNEIQVRVPANGKSGNVTLWVWKNSVVSESEFICVPGAEITGLSPEVTFPGSTIVLTGHNFSYFLEKGVKASDVIVSFQAEEGVTTAVASSFTEEAIMVEVPADARGGTISVKLGELQTVSGPLLTLIGDVKFNMLDFVAINDAHNKVTTNEKEMVKENLIESTKNGSYVIWQLTAPATGLFEPYVLAGTAKDGSYLNMDMGTDLNALKNKTVNQALTQDFKKGGWNDKNKYVFGPFLLKEGNTYFLKLTFQQDGTTWVGNVHEVGMSLAADQTQTGGIVVDNNPNLGYTLWENDFNSGKFKTPFYDAWAESPNYIKIENQYCEFHYDHTGLAANPDRRMLKGAELSCNFKTTTEGWYGFRFYLPEGKFPMDESGIIIAQIFGQGCKNSWAGHLSIDKGNLILSHRYALIDPTVGTIGKLETDKWHSVVVNFKAGRNGKGRLRAWIGEDMVEGSPVYDSGSCDFGLGHFVDDDTLDDTGTNADCKGYNGVYDALGCKFGLYVSNNVDITIRFDDLKALEGNPAGAFNIVKPGN